MRNKGMGRLKTNAEASAEARAIKARVDKFNRGTGALKNVKIPQLRIR